MDRHCLERRRNMMTSRSRHRAAFPYWNAAFLVCCVSVFCGCGGSATVAPAVATASSYMSDASNGVQTLSGWYSQSSGLYNSTGWWNAANATTVLVNYSRISNTKQYLSTISNTFTAAQNSHPGYINSYYDDEGWWALAWIDAYDLTANPAYLSMAQSIFTDMVGGWDTTTCGGGIWWNKSKTYKNAIANELFLSVAAHLANRVADPSLQSQYLRWAEKEWIWFTNSGLINSSNLINDGLTSSNPAMCVNNGATTWTYNQGVVLGGLVELNRAQADTALPTIASRIAHAAIANLTDSRGILHEPCEPSNCGGDGTQFKGIFARNLMALNDAYPQTTYKTFIDNNADSIWANDQGPNYQLGLSWSGPFDRADASRQSSALDALVAAAEMQQ